jgi:hypothetical protein
MKNSLRSLFFCAILFILQGISYAQSGAPNGINYQAVIRDNLGALVSNTPIAIRVNIRQNSATGIVIFSEKHLVTTTQYGLVNFVIGTGSFINGGAFSTINWGNGPYFLDLGVAFTGLPNPTSYLAYGTQQMMSVPYALYAKSSGNLLNQWKYGVGVPAVSLGTIGDYYLDTATGNVYNKNSGTSWILISNIIGPQGLTGATGTTGLTGPAGATGPSATNCVQIGDYHAGGIVFYIDGTCQHGLVVTPFDLLNYDINSDRVIAISICNNLKSNGYTDWYLPTLTELLQIYNSLGNGGFREPYWSSSTSPIVRWYWSSTVNAPGSGFGVNFENGTQSVWTDGNDLRIRAIRSF